MTTKNDAQLVEMERLMRSAPEPGGMESLSTLGDGVDVNKTSVQSAGHVIMWNTDTREPSTFNMNAVRAKMREVFSDDYETVDMRGQPAWTASQPTRGPWRGIVTCPLHVSRPERTAYDAFGYPRCNRIELPNEMEAREHLRKKHPQTWRQLNEAQAETERLAQAEDRDVSRRILAKIAGVELDEPVSIVSKDPVESIAPEASAIVGSDTIESPIEETSRVTKRNWKNSSKYFCGKCKRNHEVSSRIGRGHKKHNV